MNTSDPRGLTLDAASFAPSSPASHFATPSAEQAGAAPGLPDTTQLTALANEFFRGGMQALEAAGESGAQGIGPLGSPLSSAATWSAPIGTERVLRPVA